MTPLSPYHRRLFAFLSVASFFEGFDFMALGQLLPEVRAEMGLSSELQVVVMNRALQEAMVNALAHRDYELVDPARFTSYRDRIEFISPGALPLGVTLDGLRAGAVTPRWRNQALAWFLSRLQLAQAEGQGIQTIQRTMKANGCPPPVFDATEVNVTCVLKAHPRFEPKPPRERPKRKARVRRGD